MDDDVVALPRTRLDAGDLAAVLQGLDELLPVSSVLGYPEAAMSCVRKAIACDSAALTLHGPDGSRTWWSPDIRTGRTETRPEFRGPKVSGRLAFSVDGWDKLSIGITLVRAAPGFSAVDAARADALRPRLSVVFRRLLREQGAAAAILPAPWWAALTPRERDVMELVADGLTDQAIGHHLAISERTVQKHLEHAYRKLGAPNRAVASVRWRSRGTGEPDGTRGAITGTAPAARRAPPRVRPRPS